MDSGISGSEDAVTVCVGNNGPSEIPPPPPPPPDVEFLKKPHVSVVKQMKKEANGQYSVNHRPTMSDVLKDLHSVKLKPVNRYVLRYRFVQSWAYMQESFSGGEGASSEKCI